MLKWRGYRMRIGNQNKTSGWNTLIFRPWSRLQLVDECRPAHKRKNQLLLCQRNNFNEWAQSGYLLVPIGNGIFSSVLCVVHILHFFRLRDWGLPKCWGPLAVAQSAAPLIRHCWGPSSYPWQNFSWRTCVHCPPTSQLSLRKWCAWTKKAISVLLHNRKLRWTVVCCQWTWERTFQAYGIF